MRSKANFKGHPIHPALVHFPLAFLIGAFGFDLAGKWLQDPALWRVGAYLTAAGVATALLAAIPGLLDYFYTVPPKSSGKRRATLHMIYNLSAVLLFAVAGALRGSPRVEPSAVGLVLEGLAAALLVAGGYLGGILVSRNQIGVDHRYAAAGKWSEARLAADRNGTLVAARLGELEVDQLKLLHYEGRRIVLALTEDGYTAFDDRCSHRGASLADGVVISGTVQCPWHGSQFDVRTGAVCGGPARKPVQTYRVEVRGGDVVILLEGRAATKRERKRAGQPVQRKR